jgi:hypothetical protein
MTDPVSSSSVFTSSFDGMSSCDDSSSLCQGPTAPVPASGVASANACELPNDPAEAAVPSASSALVQKFTNNDYGTFIAASPSMAAPSGPPALTVRPDQLDVQTGLPRLERHATLGGLHVTADVDLLNASAHLGSLNEDGSRGETVGAGANLLNAELTLDYRGWSLSVGVGASLGGSIASGEGRDLDADGVSERCFKMTLGPFTLGECDEL